jgi:hypothetical protein
MADIGTYQMYVYVDNSPDRRNIVPFTLIVQCTIEAPVISTASPVVYEIGVNIQPLYIPYSQTLATDTCLIAGTLTTAPAATFFSLTSNSSQGGQITTNGAVLANIGTYVLTITNTTPT